MSDIVDLVKYQKLVQNNLVQLTALERTLNEQILQSGGSSTMTQYLKNLKTKRSTLMQSLQTIYSVKQTITEGTVKDYKNVIAVNKAVSQQLAEVEDMIKAYNEKIQGKQRMNQIAEYEFKKYTSYRRIIKLVVYFSIIVIVLSFLIAQPWFPKLIGKGLMIVLVSYILYYLFGILIWNFRRQTKDWDKFDQGVGKDYSADGGGVTMSKWEHNKNSIKKAFDSIGGAKGVCERAATAGAAGASAALTEASAQ
jgi:hypothetical protein